MRAVVEVLVADELLATLGDAEDGARVAVLAGGWTMAIDERDVGIEREMGMGRLGVAIIGIPATDENFGFRNLGFFGRTSTWGFVDVLATFADFIA